jgi:hypothetical protein
MCFGDLSWSEPPRSILDDLRRAYALLAKRA